MPARLIQMADAVVASLSAAELGSGATVERVYDLQVDLDQLPDSDTGVLVTVLPKESPAIPASRDDLQEEYVLDVAIRTRVPDATTATCDPLSELVERIRDHFWRETWDGASSDLALKEAVTAIPWSVQQIRESGVFFALVTLTFEDLVPMPERVTP